MSEIKAKAVLCLQDSLCNTSVHFIIVQLHDCEKVNNEPFQLYLEVFTGLHGFVPLKEPVQTGSLSSVI